MVYQNGPVAPQKHITKEWLLTIYDGKTPLRVMKMFITRWELTWWFIFYAVSNLIIVYRRFYGNAIPLFIQTSLYDSHKETNTIG